MTGQQKTREGRVVRNRTDKTVIVAINTPKRYPKYRKTITLAVNYMVHDEKNACQPGDLVRIVESRPLSRRKRWLQEIISRREVAEIQPKEIDQQEEKEGEEK
jgi:small subunit ribosomal protein S17